jgi:hypothetical protein
VLHIHKLFLGSVLALTAVPMVQLFAWKGAGVAPIIQRAAPEQTVPGGMVTVTGVQLDAKHVQELYLSAGDTRYMVGLVRQTDADITFRVPANVPPGGLSISMKLAGRTELVEEPVLLEIVEPIS